MMLWKPERNLLWLLMVFDLGIYFVSGDNPLQTMLAGFQCYSTVQPGCNTEFTKVLQKTQPNISRSFDNSSVADTRFYLFTPKNPDVPELVHKCGGVLPPNSNFNPKCKTLFFFHGFGIGICGGAIYRELVAQRMKCGCYNYIHVDWPWGSFIDMMSATENLKIVSKQIVVVLRGLKERFGLGPKDFMCVGHSLGAHGCGFVGQDESIHTIHAMDTAGVLAKYTEDKPLDQRLDPGDATCVQATYCNYGQCFPRSVSINYTVGTKNFFFNDGVHQPSCYVQLFTSILKGDFLYALASLLFPPFCSHLQCMQYYKTSMCSPDTNWVGVACKDAESFMAGECNDCGSRGENCDLTGFDSCECGIEDSRSYFLKTGLFCPYSDISGLKNVDKFMCKRRTSHQNITETSFI